MNENTSTSASGESTPTSAAAAIRAQREAHPDVVAVLADIRRCLAKSPFWAYVRNGEGAADWGSENALAVLARDDEFYVKVMDIDEKRGWFYDFVCLKEDKDAALEQAERNLGILRMMHRMSRGRR